MLCSLCGKQISGDSTLCDICTIEFHVVYKRNIKKTDESDFIKIPYFLRAEKKSLIKRAISMFRNLWV